MAANGPTGSAGPTFDLDVGDVAGVTGATGAGLGTAAVIPGDLHAYARISDGLYIHRHTTLTPPPPPAPHVTEPHASAIGPGLEAVVFLLALYGLLATGSRAAYAVLRSGVLRGLRPA